MKKALLLLLLINTHYLFSQTFYKLKPITFNKYAISSNIFWYDTNNDNLLDALYAVRDTIFKNLNLGNGNFGQKEKLWISPSSNSITQIYFDSVKNDLVAFQGGFWIKNILGFGNLDTIISEVSSGVITDLFNDRLPDLITATFMKTYIVYGLNNPVSVINEGSAKIIVSDLNNDNKPDLVRVQNQVGHPIFWHKNIDENNYYSEADFIKDTVDFSPGADYSGQIQTNDINGDGFQDIIAMNVGQKKIIWYENNKDGNFKSKKILKEGFDFNDIDFFDLDNDGDLDLIWAAGTGTFTGKVAWLENLNGKGLFKDTVFNESIYTGTGTASDLSYFDIDNDGDKDLSFVLSGNLNIASKNKLMIDKQPQPYTSCIGENIMFDVKGNSEGTYAWKRSTDGGKTFSGYKTDNQLGSPLNDTLFIKNVSSNLDGNYFFCEFSIEHNGTKIFVNSDTIKLQVKKAFNLNISVDDVSLELKESGKNYAWINCKNNILIPNATNQSFNPIESGSYAAIISDGVCVDTTSCVQFIIQSNEIWKNQFDSRFKVYPNPANELVTIEFDNEKNGLIQIIDLSGRLIESIRLDKVAKKIIQLSLSSGKYNVEYRGDDGEFFIKPLIIL